LPMTSWSRTSASGGMHLSKVWTKSEAQNLIFLLKIETETWLNRRWKTWNVEILWPGLNCGIFLSKDKDNNEDKNKIKHRLEMWRWLFRCPGVNDNFKPRFAFQQWNRG
jgi:hypothetical protein